MRAFLCEKNMDWMVEKKNYSKKKLGEEESKYKEDEGIEKL